MGEVFSVREASSSRPSVIEPVVPPQRRSPPRAIKLALPVWGYRFVRQFLESSLPTLLAPGNIPALAKALPCEFVILTSAEDEAFIREHPAFKRLAAVCRTEIRLVDHLITDGNYSTTITLAYTELVRSAGQAMVDTCFFFLVCDYVVADGSLARAFERVNRGASAVLVGNFQVVLEDALPWLQDRLRTAGASLALPARELMRWALAHLHPVTIANTVNLPFYHNAHTNRLFWRVDGGALLGRFYLMHMLCVRPEVADFVIGSSCDYSFVPEMCPSGNVDVITDSDEYLVIEMQPRDHESGFLRSGPLKSRVLAKSLAEWTTERHRDNVRHSVIYHAGDVPEGIAANIAEADAFVEEVAHAIKVKARPYRGHPYWRGAMAAFHEATGEKLSPDEWRLALGLPPTASWPTDWLVWRARHTVLGRPPHVLFWHPRWADFRLVLQELEPFFTDPNQRLLMISNAPTAFTVSLADSGERAYRLRRTPFLQSPRERYEPLAGRFDLCLLELAEHEMAEGDDLVDRIAPLMKPGGRILVVVYNRRSARDAHNFAQSANDYSMRFLRPAATPAAIYFVPASRLRFMVHQAMVRIGHLANRRPLLGVLSMLVSGSVLLPLCMLSNLNSLYRTRRTDSRPGLASSFVMVMRADPYNAEDAHLYSRSEIVRKRERNRRTISDATRQPREADALQAFPATEERTQEPQYSRCLELENALGLTTLGLMTNQVWYDDPRRLGFLLSRYKFVAKMLSGRRDVGEIGCGDAFGTRIVLQEVESVTVYDFDPLFIADIQARQDERWPLEAHVHDIVAGTLSRRHDSLYSLDVIEHIAREDEHAYLANLRGSLADDGILIIGTPSIESQAHASPPSKVGHINCKSGMELKVLLEQYFTNVLMFSMNDEVVHTGFYPMAHYLFAVCSGKK